MKTHYDVLGVAPTAPDHVIKAAYRASIKNAHPDAGGVGDAGAVNVAYRILSDPQKREAYDQELTAQATVSSPESHGPQPVSVDPEPTHPQRTPEDPQERALRILKGQGIYRTVPGLLISSLVLALISAVSSVVMLHGHPDTVEAWLLTVAVAGVYLLGINRIPSQRRWLIFLACVSASVAIGWLTLDGLAWIVTLATACVSSLVFAWAVRNIRLGKWEENVDRLFDIGESAGVGVWFVERVEQVGQIVWLSLQSIDDDRRLTARAWGSTEQGAYIAVDASKELMDVLAHVPFEQMDAVSRRRARRSRREHAR